MRTLFYRVLVRSTGTERVKGSRTRASRSWLFSFFRWALGLQRAHIFERVGSMYLGEGGWKVEFNVCAVGKGIGMGTFGTGWWLRAVKGAACIRHILLRRGCLLHSPRFNCGIVETLLFYCAMGI